MSRNPFNPFRAARRAAGCALVAALALLVLACSTGYGLALLLQAWVAGQNLH